MRQIEGAVIKRKVSKKKNARVSPRFPLMVLEVKGKHGSKIFFGYAENISPGGLFVSGKTTPTVGEQFPVEFILPDNKTKVRCTCEVVWKKQYGKNDLVFGGIGIKFVDLDQKVKKAVEKWIDQEDRAKKHASR